MAQRMEIIGVRVVYESGNRREMTGIAPAHARRMFAAWLLLDGVREVKFIYAREA